MRRGLQVIGNALREEVTAEGLRRYYRDMSRRFWPRLIVVVLGALIHGVIHEWWSGAVILVTAVGMEVVEERFARRILRRPIEERDLPRLRRRSLVQALLFGAAFSLAVLLIWSKDVEGSAVLGLVLVLGCAFEAGFLVATNRLAALLKLALYALTVVGYFAFTIATEGWSRDLTLQVCSVGILGYLVAMFLIDVRGGRRIQARNAAALAERGAALEEALADLTDKERAMRRFALAAEHAHDSIVITGPDGRIEWVNAGFTARTGWTLADVASRPSRLMADPDNDPTMLGALNAAVEARRPFRGQLRVWCRGDRWVWYDVSLTPLFDEDGRFEHYISVERDISETKAREAELARQEAEMRRLALVAEHARDAVVIYSPEGRIEWVNAGFTAQTGYEPHEIMGRMSGMLVPAGGDTEGVLRIRAAMAAERAVRAELRLSRKDGAPFWCEVSLSPVHGGDGSLRHYVGVERDITDLKEREAELADKERENRRLAMVAEHATDSITLADARGRVEWVNSSFTVESGWCLGEVKGRHLKSFIAPDCDPALLAGLDEAVRAERPFRSQLRIARPYGPVWHDVIATPIHDEDEVLTHWITVERDITEAKAREAELAEKERENRRLALAASHATDSIVITRQDGAIDWANAAFAAQVGAGAEELVGRSILEFDTDEVDPEPLSRIMAAIEARRPVREQLRLMRGGAMRWHDVSITPMEASGEPYYEVTVERDISDLKAREAALADARRAAEAAAEAKARFLATMSHEIRTPMNGIIGTADLLAESPLDDDQRRLLRTIAMSSEALLRIINDILDLSKLEAERVEVASEPFAPAELAEVCAQLLRPLAERKGLDLALAVEDGARGRLLGDPGRLQQIVLNLLGNAIKFTEAGRVELRVGLFPSGGNGGERRRLRIAVADTGIGIEPDRLEGVFDAFTQADGTITRRFGGTGLGLSISRKLTEAMGGALEAASTPGEGSTFTLEIELPPARDEAAGDAEAAPRLPEATPADALGRAGRDDPPMGAPDDPVPDPGAVALADAALVLLVEDNATNRFLAQRMLDGAGLRIAVAEDGAEGVAAFERLAPDLVIMDVSMPVMDGLEATRRIRAIEAGRGSGPEGGGPCPILALTANAHSDDRARGEEAGVTAFLTKPIRKADLRAAVTAALRPDAEARLDAAWPDGRAGAEREAGAAAAVGG